MTSFDTVAELNAYRALGSLEELSALVQKKNDGMLVELPCKVGDTLYSLRNLGKRSERCATDCYNCFGSCPFAEEELDQQLYEIEPFEVRSASSAVIAIEKIGKTMFFSQEEAEAHIPNGGVLV